ncbi:CRISPR-associated protein Cas5 [Agrilactobacillus fermenti]|uniref:CRISPR-associated protein Cas5 n=1 Tax=Agrilactobacillus fermenti TaxID=2586909 RepID=UPI001E577B6C|nr:CRISPR-associated protein Cas5 [Agrilactobacillus fermenti]MCD2257200.1 CRISPR-associated protein Cas5 [Agrilactobacillus fermenti]
MKGIKLCLHQETANYRKPASFGLRETYPLPPYSTIIGMVHYLADFQTYHPMKISVQGSYFSKTNDVFTRYEFKNGAKFEPSRHNINVNGMGVTRGIGSTELLVDVDLMIHIVPADEQDLELIYQALKKPRAYPALGRHEDLAVFESVNKVDINETEIEEMTNEQYHKGNPNWAAYFPIDLITETETVEVESTESNVAGTRYHIPKRYELKNYGNKKQPKLARVWVEKPEVIYGSQFYLYDEQLVDSEGDLVFLA